MKLWYVYETIRDFGPGRREQDRDATFRHLVMAETGEAAIEIMKHRDNGAWKIDWSFTAEEEPYFSLGLMKKPLPRVK